MHHCKQQLRKFLFCSLCRFQSVLHLLCSTHQVIFELQRPCNKECSVFAVAVHIRSFKVVCCCKHLMNVNLIFHKAPQGKIKEHLIWRSGRPESGLSSAKPALGQLPSQELCHLIVNVWWCINMMKNIQFVCK